MKDFEKTKLYDFTMSLPLQALYAWGVWTIGRDLAKRYRALTDGGDQLGWIGLTADVLTMLFLSVLLVLLIVRRVPQAKLKGIMPRFAAVMGTCANVSFTLIPEADLPTALAILIMVPVIVGTFGTIIVALWLGRQFSIMPEARRLVTAGPYALVRHPLYFCEELAFVGIALQHQPIALILLASQFTFQLIRMQYEEQVLSTTFPEYGKYAARTSRLIPGIY